MTETETPTKTPQRVLVYNHLKIHGYITDVVAQNYGIRRLASRIDELKKNGIRITAERRRDDLGRHYAYYTLTDKCAKRGCRYCDAPAANIPPR